MKSSLFSRRKSTGGRRMKRIEGKPVLMGTQVTANYSEQQVPAYKETLIEAQPLIRSPVRLSALLPSTLTLIHRAGLAGTYPNALCLSVAKLLQPLPIHFDMETRFSVMIRQGMFHVIRHCRFFKDSFQQGFIICSKGERMKRDTTSLAIGLHQMGFVLLAQAGLGNRLP